MPARRTWLSRLGQTSRRPTRRQPIPARSVERLESRSLMAADPTIAWSSYLYSQPGNQVIRNAWVAPDNSVFIEWSDGPTNKSGLEQFDHRLQPNGQWATRGDFFLGTRETIDYRGRQQPMGISDIVFGSHYDSTSGLSTPAMYVVGETNVGGRVTGAYDRVAEEGRRGDWASPGTFDPSHNEFHIGGYTSPETGNPQLIPYETIQEGFIQKIGYTGESIGTEWWSTYLGSDSREWVHSAFVQARPGGHDSIFLGGASRPHVYWNRNAERWIWSGATSWASATNDNTVFDDTPAFPTGANPATGDISSYEGWLTKLEGFAHTAAIPQNAWSTYVSPNGQRITERDGATRGDIGTAVTYNGASVDFIWVDSRQHVWALVDGGRLFQFDQQGYLLSRPRSIPLAMSQITRQIVSGNSLFLLGIDNRGKNVVKRVVLEDPADPDNNWSIKWPLELGDIAPSCMAVSREGDAVYLAGNTAIGGPEIEGVLNANGDLVRATGRRSGPNDGYLIQVNAASGDPDWMRYIGGEGTETVSAVAALDNGIVWVLGDTDSHVNPALGLEPPADYWITRERNGFGNKLEFQSPGTLARDGFVVAVKTDDRVSAITVSGAGNVLIADGDTTPSRSDGTDFGRASIGNPVTQVFTIRNPGNGRLTLGSPSLPEGFSFATPLPIVVEAGQSATFSVRLDAATTAPLGVTTGTLSFSTNDPTKPVFDFRIRGELVAEALPEITVADITVLEGNSSSTPTPATFTVSVTPAVAAGRSATVSYRIVSGTATSGRDFRTASAGGTLVFAAGESSKTVTVDVLGDRNREDNETFRIVLSAASGATILTGEATCTITDDDSVSVPVDPGQRPSLTFENVRVAEGSGPATVTVRLSAASQSIVSVQYVTANGTAQSGSDYTRTSGKLTFSPGETVKTVPIPLVNDAGSEADETFTLRFSSAVNATLPVSAATITILNDDEAGAAPVPVVSNQTINEGNTGRPSMRFTITLAAAAAQTITYGVRTADGTAVAGVDFVALREGQTVTFRKGQRTATVVVSVIANRVAQANRSFQLELTSGAGSVVARGTGTIRDDDAATASLLSQSIGSQLQSQSQPSGSALRLPRAI